MNFGGGSLFDPLQCVTYCRKWTKGRDYAFIRQEILLLFVINLLFLLQQIISRLLTIKSKLDLYLYPVGQWFPDAG